MPHDFDANEILGEATAIAAIPAPPGFESARAALVVEQLRALPSWSVRTDSVGNVIAASTPRILDGAVWVLVHLDTVFPIETPLAFEASPAVAKGPGIGDNAVAIASTLAIARQGGLLRDEGRPIVLAFTVGEESYGNLKGAKALLERGGGRNAGAVIAVEGHRGDEIGTEMVGSIRFRLEMSGPGGHSWWDRGRPSALHDLIALCQQLLSVGSQQLPRVAVNIGTLEGGTGVTAIAAHAAAALEGRAVEAADLEGFSLLVRELAENWPRPFNVTEIGSRPGGRLSTAHPIVELAQEARRRNGLPRAPFGSSSSDANPFIAAGIPALTIGITTGRRAHQLDEEIDIPPIAAGTLALRELITLLRDAPSLPPA